MLLLRCVSKCLFNFMKMIYSSINVFCSPEIAEYDIPIPFTTEVEFKRESFGRGPYWWWSAPVPALAGILAVVAGTRDRGMIFNSEFKRSKHKIHSCLRNCPDNKRDLYFD